jgi:hypothetical protein
VDGITFASKAEARRYMELKDLERRGYIGNLELQPRYPLIVNGVKCADFVADFRYRSLGVGPREVVEDVKGMDLPMGRLKRKMVKAQYGVDVVLVKARA